MSTSRFLWLVLSLSTSLCGPMAAARGAQVQRACDLSDERDYPCDIIGHTDTGQVYIDLPVTTAAEVPTWRSGNYSHLEGVRQKLLHAVNAYGCHFRPGKCEIQQKGTDGRPHQLIRNGVRIAWAGGGMRDSLEQIQRLLEEAGACSLASTAPRSHESPETHPRPRQGHGCAPPETPGRRVCKIVTLDRMIFIDVPGLRPKQMPSWSASQYAEAEGILQKISFAINTLKCDIQPVQCRLDSSLLPGIVMPPTAQRAVYSDLLATTKTDDDAKQLLAKLRQLGICKDDVPRTH